MRFRALILTSLLILFTACSTVAPTPILMGRVTALNSEVIVLYTACSNGANYVPLKEGCAPGLLGIKVDETLALSREFISADIRQAPGYDIYLATTMIYFRIGQRNLNDYSLAEQIARQFFEVQKAHSQRALTDARFYWAWFVAASASKQFYEDPLALDLERKSELLLALGEGTSILTAVEGARLVRLHNALDILQFVLNSIQVRMEIREGDCGDTYYRSSCCGLGFLCLEARWATLRTSSGVLVEWDDFNSKRGRVFPHIG